MATVDPQGGAVQSEAGQGDAAATAAAAAAAEAGAGAGAGGDAQSEAAAARESYIAEAREAARVAAREEWARLQSQPAAPAAQPPTAARGEYAELQSEGQAIAAERARVQQAYARDGYTAENLVAHNELTAREGRWLAQVQLAGMQKLERDTAVSKRGEEEAWQAFAAQHPGVDPGLLRDAFEKRQEREAAAKKPATTTAAATTTAGRSAVNVSGTSEVTAQQAKARTMTREQQSQHRASLRADGKDAEAAAFDRDIRNGKVLTKG